MVLDQIKRQRKAILALAEQHGIDGIRIFGSVVRGEERPDSDVDFLVHIKNWKGLGDYNAFAEALEKMLGRKVDLVMEGGLSPHLANYVLKEARDI